MEKQRGRTLEKKTKLEWDADPNVRLAFSCFASYMMVKKLMPTEETEALCEIYQSKHACSYEEAILAVSKQYPELFN